MTSSNGLQRRKLRAHPHFVRQFRDEPATAEYVAGMRKSERNPYDSAAPTLFTEYPPNSDIGRLVRRGDARWRLAEMAAAEQQIHRQEMANAAITSRIARMQAEHELDMQYLIQFGIKASERATFHRILEEVSSNGELSLREAADLVRTRRHTDVERSESV